MSPVLRVADNQAAGSRRDAPAAPLQKRAAASRSQAAARQAKLKGGKRVPGTKKIVNELLPGFSRQLSAMLAAGMPIVSSLEALEEQAENPNFRAVIQQVRRNIENGAAMSEALRQFPSVFDDLYCNMVRGGESAGQISETIGRLADFLEASASLRRKVKSAMMYPTIVMCVALGIAAAMIVFIVPVFGQMFKDFGADLPGPTQFLLNTSDFCRKYGIYIMMAIVLLVVLFRKWKATEQGALTIDNMLLRLPVFGELNRKVASSRFARTLGQLIRSGVPILSAMQIVAGATGNKVAAEVVMRARRSVEVGDPLGAALKDQTVFPTMLVRMVQAGEQTGKLDEMMDNIANYYDEEIETMLSGLTSLLEPLLMIFLGVIIGGIVLCMFLPIFKMGEIVSK